jgi:hypothetical protein
MIQPKPAPVRHRALDPGAGAAGACLLSCAVQAEPERKRVDRVWLGQKRGRWTVDIEPIREPGSRGLGPPRGRGSLRSAVDASVQQ